MHWAGRVKILKQCNTFCHFFNRNCQAYQKLTHAFYKQHLFRSQPQCCLAFSSIELQMLLRSCLIHTSIIILRHFIFLLYFCPFLDLCLLKSY